MNCVAKEGCTTVQMSMILRMYLLGRVSLELMNKTLRPALARLREDEPMQDAGPLWHQRPNGPLIGSRKRGLTLQLGVPLPLSFLI